MKFLSRATRFALNRIPTQTVNFTYDLYSRFYKGQLLLGLPVSSKLLDTAEEIRKRRSASWRSRCRTPSCA